MVPTILLAAVVLYMQWQAYTQDQRLNVERGQLLAQSFSDAAVVGVIAGDTSSLQMLARTFSARHKEVVGIEIVGKANDLLVRFVPGVESGRNGMPEPLIGTAARPIFREDVRMDAAPLDIELFAVMSESQRLAASNLGTVAVAVDMGVLGGGVWRQQWLVVCAAFVVLLLSLLSSRYLVRWSLYPLRDALSSLRKASAEHDGVSTDIEVLERAVMVVTESRETQLAQLEAALLDRTLKLRVTVQQLQQSVEREREGNAERRKLIQKINTTIEAERQSIASELHDELGATFTVIRLRAEHIESICGSVENPRSEPQHPPQPASPSTRLEIMTSAAEIAKMSKSVYASVRRIVRQLRPEMLETLGLSATLQELVDLYADAQKKTTHFYAHIDERCDQASFPLQMAIYRLVQEAFTNVAKHARASHCHLTVDLRFGGSKIVIVIEDNGVGLSESTHHPRGLGLIGMSERVEALQGELTFSSPLDGRGTIITATLPLQAAPTKQR